MNTLENINTKFESYQKFIRFYEDNKNVTNSVIGLQIIKFFDANLSSVLGALLDLFQSNNNKIDILPLPKKIEEILYKNKFLSVFGKGQITDTFNTTIPFIKLPKNESKAFIKYVIDNFFQNHNRNLPKMSKPLESKILEAIGEIFENAKNHSETNYIYACGQFFPQKDLLNFTLVDTGIGFKNRINRRFNKNLNSVSAIRWAIQDKMTTKENIPGGIGLALLNEFIKANQGSIQIVSNDGFYEFKDKKENFRNFQGEFPGTIVNLCFNTNDLNKYSLLGETQLKDIF